MRISDWNSDVCSSDLLLGCALISVRIERSRDAYRWCTAARCLDFARHERILAERLRHRRIREVDISEPLGKLQRGFEAVGEPRAERSEERRVGKECGHTCKCRWSRVIKKKNKT